jgi:glutaredoxin 3
MRRTISRLLGHDPDAARARVEIYTWRACPFCLRARWLLWLRGVDYIEYRIDGDERARERMAARAQGRRTVPQIFIDDEPIGGLDELTELKRSGRLGPLLARSGP